MQIMLDTVQAALHFTNGFVYFFKGDRYVKWEPGSGVVTLQGGRVLRRLGVDGWASLPVGFHSGIDAAFYYPPRDAVYFFKGNQYVKWKDGGPVAKGGSFLRTIGVDGWQTLPAEYTSGFDAVLYHEERDHAYFFKGPTYVKYKPGSGVVTANGNKTRRLGVTGWTSLPLAFQRGVDAAMYYRENGRIYFFKGRQYARWNPEEGDEGLDPRYPRRIGLRNGLSMQRGWPGLSHVLAGPLAGHTTESETRVWVWLADGTTAETIDVQLNGQAASFTAVDPISSSLRPAVDAVHNGSAMRELVLNGLSPGVSHRVDLLLDGIILESLQVRTPPAPSDRGDVDLAFVSCTNFNKEDESAPVLRALSEWQPDLTLFCGDNCYYIGGNGSTKRSKATAPVDWADTALMLLRQMQARNHPEMADLLLRGPAFSTWDDHDFGFNNSRGGHDPEPEPDWVGRTPSSRVFRACWPNAYVLEQGNIRHGFRWGPIHVFMPDARFDKNDRIWGATQLNWLLAAMRTSDAPLKIVVTSGQFLSTTGTEGHLEESPQERQDFLDRIRGIGDGAPVSGKVLILSGDVHYTSLVRAREDDGVVMEFTSSGAKRGGGGGYPDEPIAATRLWASRRDNFGAVHISINRLNGSRVIGHVIFEARDGNGQIIVDTVRHRPCRTVWDLDTGDIS